MNLFKSIHILYISLNSIMEGPSPRIVKETKTIQTDPVPGIVFEPDPNNYKHFFIKLEGIHSSIKAHPEPAMKGESSKQNCYSLMTTQCHHPKLSSIPRSTIPTSVLHLLFRQLGPNLSRHSKEKLVASSADEVGFAVDPEFVG